MHDREVVARQELVDQKLRVPRPSTLRQGGSVCFLRRMRGRHEPPPPLERSSAASWVVSRAIAPAQASTSAQSRKSPTGSNARAAGSFLSNRWEIPSVPASSAPIPLVAPCLLAYTTNTDNSIDRSLDEDPSVYPRAAAASPSAERSTSGKPAAIDAGKYGDAAVPRVEPLSQGGADSGSPSRPIDSGDSSRAGEPHQTLAATNTLRTVAGHHRAPPWAVATPSSFNAAAMAANVHPDRRCDTTLETTTSSSCPARPRPGHGS